MLILTAKFKIDDRITLNKVLLLLFKRNSPKLYYFTKQNWFLDIMLRSWPCTETMFLMLPKKYYWRSNILLNFWNFILTSVTQSFAYIILYCDKSCVYDITQDISVFYPNFSIFLNVNTYYNLRKRMFNVWKYDMILIVCT